MNTTATYDKKDILKQAGFKFHFDKDIYVNRNKKKIFSLEAIEDHDEKWLQQCVDEDHADWKFYCNTPPTEYVKQELINEVS